jgi:hypothetical protein
MDVRSLHERKQGLQRALGDRVYLGEWRLPDGKWMPNHHEPLVDLETSGRAQKLAR